MLLVSCFLQPAREVANDVGVIEVRQGLDLSKSFPEAEEQKRPFDCGRLHRSCQTDVDSLVAAHDLDSHLLVQQFVSGLVNLTKGSSSQKNDGVKF